MYIEIYIYIYVDIYVLIYIYLRRYQNEILVVRPLLSRDVVQSKLEKVVTENSTKRILQH